MLRVDDVVEVAHELDGFEIFPAAELVGNPFALLARIIEVKHGRDGIDTEAVDVKAFAPEERVGGEEVTDFVPAIIEDERAPILVGAFAWIFVLVKRSAVEAGEGPFVARKMSGHPIDDHADAAFMERVDEVLKIIRRAVAAGSRVKAGDLITPRWIKGMLRNRHEFHMGEIQLTEVIDERAGHFAVAEGFEVVLLAP